MPKPVRASRPRELSCVVHSTAHHCVFKTRTHNKKKRGHERQKGRIERETQHPHPCTVSLTQQIIRLLRTPRPAQLPSHLEGRSSSSSSSSPLSSSSPQPRRKPCRQKPCRNAPRSRSTTWRVDHLPFPLTLPHSTKDKNSSNNGVSYQVRHMWRRRMCIGQRCLNCTAKSRHLHRHPRRLPLWGHRHSARRGPRLWSRAWPPTPILLFHSLHHHATCCPMSHQLRSPSRQRQRRRPTLLIWARTPPTATHRSHPLPPRPRAELRPSRLFSSLVSVTRGARASM